MEAKGHQNRKKQSHDDCHIYTREMIDASAKSLPLQGKVAERSEVGRGRSPCGIDSLRGFFQENDLIRLSRNNASIFREIHLPLKRRLRLLGKAFGSAVAKLTVVILSGEVARRRRVGGVHHPSS